MNRSINGLTYEVVIEIIASKEHYPINFKDVCIWCNHVNFNYALFILSKTCEVDLDFIMINYNEIRLNIEGAKKFIHHSRDYDHHNERRCDSCFTKALIVIEEGEQMYVNPYIVKFLYKRERRKIINYFIDTSTHEIYMDVISLADLTKKSKYEVKEYFLTIKKYPKLINYVNRATLIKEQYEVADQKTSVDCIQYFAPRILTEMRQKSDTFRKHVFKICQYDKNKNYLV